MMSLFDPLRPPNYDLGAPMFDGVNAPRWWHHAGRALVSCVIALVIPNVAHASPFFTALEAWLLAGVLPHVVGVVSRAYPFDFPDWCADAWIAAAPFVVATWIVAGPYFGAIALLFYVWGYLRLYPYASP